MKKKELTAGLVTGAALLASVTVGNAFVEAEETATVTPTIETKIEEMTVASQEQVVAQAASELDASKMKAAAAQESVTKAQKTLEQATPEAVAQADQAVTDAVKLVETAEATVKEKEATLAQETAKVSEQEKVVAEEEKKVAAAKAEADKAKAKETVSEAQAVVDGKISDPAVTKAAEAVKAAEATVAQKEKDLTAAEEADKNRQAAIDAGQKSVSEAQADVVAKEAAVAKLATNVQQKFTLSADYISTLKKYKEIGYFEFKESDGDVLANEVEKLISTNNYKSNEVDKKRIYNINQLPSDIVGELSFYTQDLINQVRNQVGTTPISVTNNTIDYAVALGKAYSGENYKDYSDTHYSVFFNRPEIRKYNLSKYGYRTTGLEYDYYNTLLLKETLSIDEMKQIIYDGVRRGLFVEDTKTSSSIFAWRNAFDLAGISSNPLPYGANGVDIKVAVTFSASTYNNFMHLVMASLSDIEDQSKITPALKNPNAVDSSEADKAQTELAVAKGKLADTKAELEKAQQQLERGALAKVDLENAQKALTEAQNAYAAALAASNQADQAKKTQADLDAAKTALSQKEAQVKTAEAGLAAATMTLEALKQAESVAQEAVTSAQEALSQAQAKVAETSARLAALKDADKNFLQAADELVQAQLDLAEKEINYQEAVALLEILKLRQQLEDGLKQQTPVVAVKPTAMPVATKAPKGMADMNAEKVAKSKNAKATLPATGEETSVLLSMFGLVGLATLGMKKRKRS